MNRKIIFALSLFVLCILFIPNVYAYDSGREVFIRHINKDTGEIISGLQNTNQEVISQNGESSLLNNSNADDATIDYSEYYNYPVASTMKLTKTLVMQVNGTKYDYLGYNICTQPSLDEAYSIAEEKKSGVRAGTAQLDMDYNNNLSNAQVSTIQSNNMMLQLLIFIIQRRL